MPKDTLPNADAYLEIVAAGVDWLATTLGHADFLVSSQVHAGNPDVGVEPILTHFARQDRPYVKRQVDRLSSSTAMTLKAGKLRVGRIVGRRTFDSAYDALQDGHEQRQLVVVMTPCLSRSRQLGFIQFQVSRLADARELAEHHEAMRDAYPQDWLNEYGLPDTVVIASDYPLVLEAVQERWQVKKVR